MGAILEGNIVSYTLSEEDTQVVKAEAVGQNRPAIIVNNFDPDNVGGTPNLMVFLDAEEDLLFSNAVPLLSKQDVPHDKNGAKGTYREDDGEFWKYNRPRPSAHPNQQNQQNQKGDQ